MASILILRRSSHELSVQVDFDGGAHETVDVIRLLGDRGDLQQAFLTHSGDAAIYLSLLATITSRLEQAELLAEQVEGELWLAYAKQCREEGLAATVTLPTIKARLACSRELAEAKEAVLQLKEHQRRAKVFTDAFAHRRDMLVSAGAQQRHQEAVQEGLRILGSSVRRGLTGSPTE